MKRESCEAKGTERTCRVPISFGGKCQNGMQKCQPDYLKDYQKWGVCEPNCRDCQANEKKACGVCDSCRLRLKGFNLAGEIDKIEYEK